MRIFVNLGVAYPTNVILEFFTHCHCTKYRVDIIVRRYSRIKYYVIIKVGDSTKMEKEKKTTANNNRRGVIEINAMDETTYEDI